MHAYLAVAGAGDAMIVQRGDPQVSDRADQSLSGMTARRCQPQISHLAAGNPRNLNEQVSESVCESLLRSDLK